MKTCTKCGEILPATTEYFYKGSRSKNKLQSWCKACMKKESTERFKARQEAEKARERIIEAEAPKLNVPKFAIGQGVKVGDKYGRVCGVFKHFIVVGFKKYKESFNLVDIQLRQEQIKIGGKSI